MDYFLLRQSGQAATNQKEIEETEDATLCKIEEVTQIRGMDYIAKESLVSDRLKLLLESYLPKNNWKPYVFMDMTKEEQEVFWYLELEMYLPEQLEFHSAGYPCGIQVDVEKVPRIFKIAAKNGITFIILHLSVAESMMRRGILGLELIPLLANTNNRSKK